MTTKVNDRVIPCRICKADGRTPPAVDLQRATTRQTPAEPASGVAAEQVPPVAGGSDLPAGGQDGAQRQPYRARWVWPENVTRPAVGPLRRLADLFRRRRRTRALLAAGVAAEQLVAIDPTRKLPGRVQVLETVAGAARRYLEGPAEPRTEDHRIDNLARLLNLTAAMQLLDAVEAHDRELLREALADQP